MKLLMVQHVKLKWSNFIADRRLPCVILNVLCYWEITNTTPYSSMYKSYIFFIALVVDLRHDAWKTEITIFWSNSYMYLLDNYSCLLTNTHSAPLLLTIIIENEFHLLFLVTMQTVICTKNSHLAISLAAVQHDFKWLLLTTPCKNTLKTGEKNSLI